MPVPYGLGYGLGAIGAGLAHGQLAATMMQPGLQHQQMQNQMSQQQLDEQKALNVAGSIETPATGEELTPYDQDINNRAAMIKSLKAQGQGNAARKLQAELTPLAVAQQTHLLGSGAKSIISGQMGEAVTRLNKGGMKVKAITKNPDGTYTFESLDGDQPSVLTQQQVLGMAENPKDYAQQVMMAQYQSGRLHLGQEEYERKVAADKRKYDQNAERIAEVKKYHPEKLQSQENIAAIYAGAKLGVERMKPGQRTFDYLTLPEERGGLGMSPLEADHEVANIKDQIQKGKTVQDIALGHAEKQLGPGAPHDQVMALTKEYEKFLSEGQPEAQRAIVPRATQARPQAKAKVETTVQEGATATGENGHKIKFTGGKWVDALTGKAI